MKVIVDTSVWSLALRRNQIQVNPYTDLLREYIADGRVVIIGPIRQEILSGIRQADQFDKLKKYLSVFPDLDLFREDYELAAEFFNLCRSKGVQGSNTDFLICSVAKRRNYTILTSDQDFSLFCQYIPLILATP